MTSERPLRIAVLSWSRRKVGGLETFVGMLIDELHVRGHDVAFWTELDQPANRPRIELPAGVASWSVDEIGLERALSELRDWAPQVMSTHGFLDPSVEQATLGIAPATYFAHSYAGTCISGTKTFSRPEPRPCHRQFGWGCLVQYYPRRCGGLSPLTMAREFRRQSRRLDLLQRYQRIFTPSRHMREEYLRHGFTADQLAAVEVDAGSYEVLDHDAMRAGDVAGDAMLGAGADAITDGEDVDVPTRSTRGWGGPLRLLFLGRMDRLKGGRLLLDALPKLAAPDRPLRLVLAGDGPDRRRWEDDARRLMASAPGLGLEVIFEGWVDGDRRAELLNDSDLLMIPSLWPEPFGLVGREAGLHGVPSIAFAVGGIPDWLVDDVNGCLAPGDPPSVDGLVEATNRAVRDPETYRRLSRGAARYSRTFDARHGVSVVAAELEKLARGA
jgi:glycosyltransferase involved in cell wall biosynthesis